MNQGRFEDENKEKDDNIRSQMRQKWVKKSLENASQSPKNVDTQVNELGELTFQTS